MAERRMFTLKIVDSDAFLDMPISAQALYFHLNMRADDDGFVNNPKKVQRMIGASDDDFKLLLAKRFLLVFENGVIVIKHWRMHNILRKDRYKPTEYQEQYNRLFIKPNGVYTDGLEPGALPAAEQMATKWQPNGNQMAPQDRLGKDRLGKNNTSIDNNNIYINNTPTDCSNEEGIKTKACTPTVSILSELSCENSDAPPKDGKKKANTYPPGSKPYSCAEYLARSISEELPSLKPKNEEELQKWALDFDRAHRIDGHTWKEIGDVLVFSRSDLFWRKNIRSGAKFRAQYERLLAEMTASKEKEHKPDFLDLV